MKSALEFVVKGAEEDGYGVYRDAVLIHESMEGTGTKDERLSKHLCVLNSCAYASLLSLSLSSLPRHSVPLE